MTDDPRPPDRRQDDLGGPDGLTDMDPEAFRAAAHAVVDLMADYLGRVEAYPVLPPIEPGSLRPLFPAAPPEAPEPLEAILADYRALVEPNATHWQHPGFLAYFATTASGPGILGEMLTAALGQNPMLWRTSPIGTELEEVVVDWLRQALGLPDGFDGLLTDTASTSTLIALAAAREAAGARRRRARAGRPRRPRGGLRVYASSRGPLLDREGVHDPRASGGPALAPGPDRTSASSCGSTRSRRRSPTDRAAGRRPIAHRRHARDDVARRRSTRSRPIADVAEREGLWLHVDAAYAGAVALDARACARRSRGWERADSIVVNPHKWLFTPLDASLLLTRRMDVLRPAFSLVPEYLRTLDRATPVRDYNEYQPQLGRRFRALKLWIQLRWFGLDGLRRRIARHIELARRLRRAGRRRPRLGAPGAGAVLDGLLPLASGAARGHEDEPAVRQLLDERNAAIMDAVNRTGEVFLSHTRLAGRFTIRLAVGNLRTEERHVDARLGAAPREAARLDG